jgi:hypothetical protein
MNTKTIKGNDLDYSYQVISVGESNLILSFFFNGQITKMFFSTKRQQYLIDQGYTFNVNQTIVDKANIESKLLKTKEQEIEMLTMIVADEIDMENETYEDKKISKDQLTI